MIRVFDPNPKPQQIIKEVREVQANSEAYNRIKGYLLDANGYIIQEILINEKSPIPENVTTVFLPQVFKRPRWSKHFGKWIEGDKSGIVARTKSKLHLDIYDKD